MITNKTLYFLGGYLAIIALTLILCAIWGIRTETEETKILAKMFLIPATETLIGIPIVCQKYKKYKKEEENGEKKN